jgi:putative ABC transport system permease protein
VRQLYRREDGLTRLAGLLSAVSLIVAVVGLYGLLSFSVAVRTREIGIRSALGATPGAVVRAVLGEAFRVAAIGIGIGGIGFLVSQRLLGTFVYGLDEVRTLPAMLASTTLMLAALVGAYIPSRRAARVDPLIALRTD